MKFLIPAALMALIVSCTNAPDLKEAREKLLHTDRNFAAASLEKGTAEAFREYLDPEAVQLTAGKDPIRGRDNIFERMKASPARGVLSWEPKEAEVSESADMGYTWGEYKFKYTTTEGTEEVSHGKYLNVWRVQPDGSWKVVVDIGN